MKRGMAEPSKHIPLTRLYEIKDNQYRSIDNSTDYYPDMVDDLIHQKEQDKFEKQIEQQLKEMEDYEK